MQLWHICNAFSVTLLIKSATGVVAFILFDDILLFLLKVLLLFAVSFALPRIEQPLFQDYG